MSAVFLGPGVQRSEMPCATIPLSSTTMRLTLWLARLISLTPTISQAQTNLSISQNRLSNLPCVLLQRQPDGLWQRRALLLQPQK